MTLVLLDLMTYRAMLNKHVFSNIQGETSENEVSSDGADRTKMAAIASSRRS